MNNIVNNDSLVSSSIDFKRKYDFLENEQENPLNQFAQEAIQRPYIVKGKRKTCQTKGTHFWIPGDLDKIKRLYQKIKLMPEQFIKIKKEIDLINLIHDPLNKHFIKKQQPTVSKKAIRNQFQYNMLSWISEIKKEWNNTI